MPIERHTAKVRALRLFHVCVCLAVIFLAFDSALTVQGTLADSVVCYRLKNSVVLDGKLTTANEWSDAAEIALRGFSSWNKNSNLSNDGVGQTHIRVKHNNDSIYLLFNFTFQPDSECFDTKGFWDHDFEVAVDAKKDGGSHPQVDDTIYWVTYSGDGSGLGVGNGIGWKYQKNLMNFTFTYTRGYIPSTEKDLTSAVPHFFGEFKIPMPSKEDIAFFVLVNAAQGRGKCLQVWPTYFSYSDNPSSWGVLRISKEALELASPSPTTALVPPQPPTHTTTDATSESHMNGQLEKILPLIGLGAGVMSIAVALLSLLIRRK